MIKEATITAIDSGMWAVSLGWAILISASYKMKRAENETTTPSITAASGSILPLP